MNVADHREYLVRADLEILAEEFDQAKSTLSEIVDEFPFDIDALFKLGQVEANLENTDAALRWLSRALELAPGHSGARAALQKIQMAWAKPPKEVVPWDWRKWGFLFLLVAAITTFAFPILSGYADGDKEETVISCGTEPTPTPKKEDGTTALNVDRGNRFVASEARSQREPCTEANATSTKITSTDDSGPIEIPAPYAALAGGFLAAGLVLLLYPILKSAEGAGFKIEFQTEPEPTQPPAT